ncbi:hypothetical protein [Geodermatophilus dictyosporus]|uniref:hypothetical protein n=1 Tax=Geodermatophilus dictyosporus TaxID=1523247 RepID=UPI000B80E83E|nr:hypothetical protein [Geodermatophilus dictyosporus]
MSAEAQEAAFIDVDLVRRMTEGLPVTQGQEILLDRGGQWWLPEEDVISIRALLTTLLGRAGNDEDRRQLRAAVELIDLSDMGATGLLLVPAADGGADLEA